MSENDRAAPGEIHVSAVLLKLVEQVDVPSQEASVLAVTDGRTLVALQPAQDHKPAHDGDTGPNDLQNYPVLTSAVTDGGTTVTIGGTLNGTASTQLTARSCGCSISLKRTCHAA